MKKSTSLLMVLLVSVLLARYGEEEPADVMTTEEDTIVKVVLTKLDVNDQTFEIGLKIINNTDHDVWVCNGYERAGGSIRYFERFMDKDNKTLVLRRRYNLRLTWLERQAVPRNFRYLRLRPGEEKVESHSFTLPVTPLSVFILSPKGNAESAQRMAIEIGFYDEDLRALILGVVDMAERIGYDDSALSAVTHSGPLALYYRFFGGFEIAGSFKTENITYFRDSVTSDGDEILMPPMDKALNGEQVLRIEVDNVSIPYESDYPPLTGHEAKSTENQLSQELSNSNKDKPEREKG
jgi:hypothetical protein